MRDGTCACDKGSRALSRPLHFCLNLPLSGCCSSVPLDKNTVKTTDFLGRPRCSSLYSLLSLHSFHSASSISKSLQRLSSLCLVSLWLSRSVEQRWTMAQSRMLQRHQPIAKPVEKVLCSHAGGSQITLLIIWVLGEGFFA